MPRGLCRFETWIEAAQPHRCACLPMCEYGQGIVAVGAWTGIELVPCRCAHGLYFWNLGTPFEFMTGDELVENPAVAATPVWVKCRRLQNMLAGKEKLFSVDSATGGILPYYAHLSAPRPLPSQIEACVHLAYRRDWAPTADSR